MEPDAWLTESESQVTDSVASALRSSSSRIRSALQVREAIRALSDSFTLTLEASKTRSSAAARTAWPAKSSERSVSGIVTCTRNSGLRESFPLKSFRTSPGTFRSSIVTVSVLSTTENCT